MLNENLKCHPSIFAVTDNYQLFLPVKSEMLFWVEIGKNKYFDEYNGIMRTATNLHRVEFPQSVLDNEKCYTLCFKKIIDRKPYYTESEPTVKITYKFKPLTKTENINIYHIADTHGLTDAPIKAGSYFNNDLDVLILNGDIADHSGSIENISICYKIASEITKGELPCVFSRGNHDLRGNCAERLADYTPSNYGNTYYWFKLGSVFGIVTDCGEDKDDSHPEYGGTVCCDVFRKRETEFIENTVNSDIYKTDNVKYRLIVSHVPFAWNNTLIDSHGENPFQIDIERFTYWCKLFKSFNPDLMLCGHLHTTEISKIGGKYDDKGQPCTVIIGSKPDRLNNKFTGTAITLNENAADIKFTDDENNVKLSEKIFY